MASLPVSAVSIQGEVMPCDLSVKEIDMVYGGMLPPTGPNPPGLPDPKPNPNPMPLFPPWPVVVLSWPS
jgi:hypothetical protein